MIESPVTLTKYQFIITIYGYYDYDFSPPIEKSTEKKTNEFKSHQLNMPQFLQAPAEKAGVLFVNWGKAQALQTLSAEILRNQN